MGMNTTPDTITWVECTITSINPKSTQFSVRAPLAHPHHLFRIDVADLPQKVNLEVGKVIKLAVEDVGDFRRARAAGGTVPVVGVGEVGEDDTREGNVVTEGEGGQGE